MNAQMVEQLRWIGQTVHQAHHDGPIADCGKNTCTAIRDTLGALKSPTGRVPKIFVFCNTRCGGGKGDWHSFIALAEDGKGIAGHACSSHGWGWHDMGLSSSWKHEHYRKHYPDGYELVWVEDIDHPEKYAGLKEAIALNEARADELAAEGA